MLGAIDSGSHRYLEINLTERNEIYIIKEKGFPHCQKRSPHPALHIYYGLLHRRGENAIFATNHQMIQR